MARVLIVEGAERGLLLARELLGEGHAVRMVAGALEDRERIEAIGAECLIGTPNRLVTMQGALEHVTIACWLLADIGGERESILALHGPRLEQFMSRAIDSTLRGFLYEAGGDALPADVLAEGERIVSETAVRNSIPLAILGADPRECDTWLTQALLAIRFLLEGADPSIQQRYPGAYTSKS